MTTNNVVFTSGITRVSDLPDRAVYEKEGRLWVKQEAGYSMALDNFVRYQVRPTEQVEHVYSQVTVTVKR